MAAAFQKICVMGLGYIGLPTRAVIASSGLDVIGVDVNQRVVETINRGEIHIEEPDLDVLVARVVSTKKLRAALQPEPADAFIITVPTPIHHKRHTPDMSYVEAATKAIAPFLRKGNLVIIESTSPVGTTLKASKILAKLRPDLRFPHQNKGCDVHVAHCPERVLPGKILHELIHNDRMVGGITADCTEAALALYRHFVKHGECKATDAATAEMVKLTENAFRDTNIAFANELSTVCDHLGLNVWDVIRLANCHPRVNILRPGPGVGGHCIAVDPWFIVHAAPKQARMMALARQINDEKRDVVVAKTLHAASKKANPRILCLGLAFKPDVDDLRESPAVYVVEELARKIPGSIMVAEPHITSLPASLQKKRVQLVSLDEAIKEANILVALVAHKAFDGIKADHLKRKSVIDACGLWEAV